mmetsp:Transcript_11552/g.23490  ORF Transcript_11552/g.23490 Transcript_11552/m.23490 type:complete len:468 (-) Transcript_11552:112-1515(-)|eukprot:CAMPEP_0184681654 /NCGR_PEP_ID=MMETSP0312-20130426/4631_1 /TAXON_ID=31354 /ORGANISM="Compsopogon coeruleus, Strain SAG 36.94" /LENGTH=467 /DNA_ID=CAMNT_0027132631 /DNA_START=18 /DNA_END=1421 /DNA_ORIENTATION=-
MNSSSEEFRRCCQCEQDRPRSMYSKNQWNRGSLGSGLSSGSLTSSSTATSSTSSSSSSSSTVSSASHPASRCFLCVLGSKAEAPREERKVVRGEKRGGKKETLTAGGGGDLDEPVVDNLSPSLKSDWEPFQFGTFRAVCLGSYQGGPRNGQPCVIKWLHDSDGLTPEAFYRNDDRILAKTIEILRSWNALKLSPKPIRVNRPSTIMVPSEEERARRADGIVVPPHVPRIIRVETFLRNFTHFNSNSGWFSRDDDEPGEDETSDCGKETGGDKDTIKSGSIKSDDDLELAFSPSWSAIMQALSHFSFHRSAGRMVLCDLQGSIRNSGAILSDPCLVSRTPRAYGVTDLGPEGIQSFFYNHRCSKYCREDWITPRERVKPTLALVPDRHHSPKGGAVSPPDIEEVELITLEEHKRRNSSSKKGKEDASHNSDDKTPAADAKSDAKEREAKKDVDISSLGVLQRALLFQQ